MKKKKYEKPMIIIDNFSLADSIAAGCEITDVTHSKNEQGCGLNFDRQGAVFTAEMGCKYKEPDGFDGICYHVPTDSNNLFLS